MNSHEARELGDRLASLVNLQNYEKACDLLFPLLAERTPFRFLDMIGTHVGGETPEVVDQFLDQVAAQRTMGGWVVIASALRQQLSSDLPEAFTRCRTYVISADIWYATDSFGERLPGPALVTHFEPAYSLLHPWREDPNRWVRRMVGVAVHYWAKQARGEAKYRLQVNALLDLLAPLFSEGEMDAIKGVGWGLKTLGKYYPDLVAEWVEQQSAQPHRALMVHKATTYLPKELRQRLSVKMP